jgi:DNA mismatch endonuclease (patch repair protein)
MQANKRRDTAPELRIRSALHALGLRFRVDRRPIAAIAGRADVVFTRRHVAVFVDGCFWHGCAAHFSAPATNRAYWAAKIDGNRRRDHVTTAALEAAGWRVVRVWEHEDPVGAAASIATLVSESGNTGPLA